MAGQQADMGRPQPDQGAAMAGQRSAMAMPMAEEAERELDPQAQARRVYEQHQAAGANLSGAALAKQVGISERHGRRLLAELRAEAEGSTRRNGDGAARHPQVGPMPG
jgi:hypothetical protein